MNLSNMRDGDGFLKDSSVWSKDIMLNMMIDDGITVTENMEICIHTLFTD